MAIREAARVNLSDRAKRLPRSFRKESGVATVAFLPRISFKEAASGVIFSWSALIKRRFTSPGSKGETD